MEAFNNERRVQQGEDWNLDVLLSGSNREYIPFIVPMAMQHPFFTVTVGSTKFEKNYRYVETWWNEYKGPKFESTVPIFYGEVTPIIPDTVDLGERLVPPTAFNYRDYSDINPTVIQDLVTDEPYAYEYSPGSTPGHDSCKISIAFIDLCASPEIYQYILDNTVQYCRVKSYRGLKLEITNDLDTLKTKIVEIGYNEGDSDDYEVNYFAETPYNPKIYKYKLVGDNKTYYCRFNYETEELEDVDIMTDIILPSMPSEDPDDPTYGDNAIHPNLYYYTLTTDEIDPVLMHKPYYYFYYDYSTGAPVLVTEYECTIHQNFLTEETAKWNGQNYMYQITLVDGQLMADYLEAQRDLRVQEGYDLSDYPEEVEDNPSLTNELRYKYLKTRWPETFQPDIDSDSLLGTIDNIIPVLPPTKLEVFNNIRRLI